MEKKTQKRITQTRVVSPVTEFLTEIAIAERLAISRRTLQVWRVTGAGPRFVKLGAAVRYRWSDVEKWIAQCERNNTADQGRAATK